MFIDEMGDHDLKSPNEASQYLGLTGVIMKLDYADGEFTTALKKFKRDIFNSEAVVLHRREIIDRTGAFEILRDNQVRTAFDNGLTEIIRTSKYRVFTVVIDKKHHKEQYTKWHFHPYHYCLTTSVERYVQWLNRNKLTGDVMVESRGKRENRQLERAYKHIYAKGVGMFTSSYRHI